ncbi:MAG: hypothetical protein ABIE14_02645 [Patescibacteria group bacterium]
MQTVKTKSRKVFPKQDSAAEQKRDEAICLSRMKEKSISHKEFLKFCREKLGLKV